MKPQNLPSETEQEAGRHYRYSYRGQALMLDTAASTIWSRGFSSVGIFLFTDTYNVLLNFKAIGKHSAILKLIKRMH